MNPRTTGRTSLLYIRFSLDKNPWILGIFIYWYELLLGKISCIIESEICLDVLKQLFVVYKIETCTVGSCVLLVRGECEIFLVKHKLNRWLSHIRTFACVLDSGYYVTNLVFRTRRCIDWCLSSYHVFHVMFVNKLLSTIYIVYGKINMDSGFLNLLGGTCYKVHKIIDS